MKQNRILSWLGFSLVLSLLFSESFLAAVSLRKRDDSLQLPDRPALAIKHKPQRTAQDFLMAETKETSEHSFFQTVAFIGDSITQGLTLLEAFDTRPIMANLGLTLAKAKNNLEDWKADRVETIFILLGINDMTYYDMDTETYITRYDDLLSALRERFPESVLVVQSILPVASTYNHPKINNEIITTFNAALKEYCLQHEVLFAEICQPFCLEDGSLNPNFSPDGLHLFYQYYGAWLAQLEYFVEYS